MTTPARTRKKESSQPELAKCATGIAGFDEIAFGGVPRGRPTLVCGSAGCGKTLFGLEFLVRGARDYGEPGVCISFEEPGPDLAANVRSLGFDLAMLEKDRKLVIDYIQIEKDQIAETGEYDLEGLFVRIGHAIDSVKAKRILLDTPEALFAGLSDQGVLRSELRRLFIWLKNKGVTAIITGEQGDGKLTRHGLEEYISDCVVLLDQRVDHSVVTRRLRIMKYRGSRHGTNEYPFLIDEQGISVLPVTSVGLAHAAFEERISSGIPGLDEMLSGKGYFRGSSILVSGTAGSGKTSVAASFLVSACERGEPALYFTFEESPEQLLRNMRSIGLNLDRWRKQGLLFVRAARPSAFGLEMHLVQMHQLIRELNPRAVVLDPISSLLGDAAQHDVKTMVLRMVDHLKHTGATALFTTLMDSPGLETTDINLSSLVDTWIQLKNIETDGERNRLVQILKSRGMAHSNQVREFNLSDNGIELNPVYLGSAGVLTGSARIQQEARERQQEAARKQELQRRQSVLQRALRTLDTQIHALRAEREAQERELAAIGTEETTYRAALNEERQTLSVSRHRPTETKQNGTANKSGSKRI